MSMLLLMRKLRSLLTSWPKSLTQKLFSPISWCEFTSQWDSSMIHLYSMSKYLKRPSLDLMHTIEIRPWWVINKRYNTKATRIFSMLPFNISLHFKNGVYSEIILPHRSYHHLFPAGIIFLRPGLDLLKSLTAKEKLYWNMKRLSAHWMRNGSLMVNGTRNKRMWLLTCCSWELIRCQKSLSPHHYWTCISEMFCKKIWSNALVRSKKVKVDTMKKLLAMNSGLNFRVPCRSICSILADYLRVSSDHLPYCFIEQTKSIAYATSNASDDPMTTVRLHARNGSKDMKVVSTHTGSVVPCNRTKIQFTFHSLLMDTCYPNVYFGLTLLKYGHPIWDVLGHWRMGELPPFTVMQAAGQPSGIVTTPPPHYLINYGPSLPTPKGRSHVCLVQIRKCSQGKFVRWNRKQFLLASL